jgi:hypothetical protein
MRKLTTLIVAILFAAANSQAAAQSDPNSGRADREDLLRSALKSWDKSDIATSDRYLVAYRDLNGDGKDEAVVYVIGHDWCGTGGCTTLILARRGSSWKVISRTATTRLPIRILDGTSHGWCSLGVWVQGGGIYPGYEGELRFNGKTYTSNPSEPPAVPMKGVAGEVLIPNDEKAAKPLYTGGK